MEDDESNETESSEDSQPSGEVELSTECYAGDGTSVEWAFEDIDQMMATAGITLDPGPGDYPDGDPDEGVT